MKPSSIAQGILQAILYLFLIAGGGLCTLPLTITYYLYYHRSGDFAYRQTNNSVS